MKCLLLFFFLFSVIFFNFFLIFLTRGIWVICIHLHPLTLLGSINACYLIAIVVLVSEAGVLYVARASELQSIEDVVVTGDYQITSDHQLVESIVVSLNDQSINLLISIWLCKNLVVMASDDHGLDVTRHFYPIVVTVHRKVLYMISDPFRTVVLVNWIRVLLRGLCTLSRRIWSRLVTLCIIICLLVSSSVSMSVRRLLLWSWMVRPSWRLGMVMGMMVLVMRGLVMLLLLRTLWHILEGCIGLLLLLLYDGIDVRHNAVEARYIRHSAHKEHVVIVWIHLKRSIAVIWFCVKRSSCQ